MINLSRRRSAIARIFRWAVLRGVFFTATSWTLLRWFLRGSAWIFTAVFIASICYLNLRGYGIEATVWFLAYLCALGWALCVICDHTLPFFRQVVTLRGALRDTPRVFENEEGRSLELLLQLSDRYGRPHCVQVYAVEAEHPESLRSLLTGAAIEIEGSVHLWWQPDLEGPLVWIRAQEIKVLQPDEAVIQDDRRSPVLR